MIIVSNFIFFFIIRRFNMHASLRMMVQASKGQTEQRENAISLYIIVILHQCGYCVQSTRPLVQQYV